MDFPYRWTVLSMRTSTYSCNYQEVWKKISTNNLCSWIMFTVPSNWNCLHEIIIQQGHDIFQYTVHNALGLCSVTADIFWKPGTILKSFHQYSTRKPGQPITYLSNSLKPIPSLLIIASGPSITVASWDWVEWHPTIKHGIWIGIKLMKLKYNSVWDQY